MDKVYLILNGNDICERIVSAWATYSAAEREVAELTATALKNGHLGPPDYSISELVIGLSLPDEL